MNNNLLGNDNVAVIAPARLHLGFFDMHGGNGRLFGSFGLSLNEIHTHISASQAKDVIIRGASRNRASNYVGRILDHFGIEHGVNMNIHQAIPEHAGLGSGTQLSLAIGSIIASLYDKEITTAKIAQIMERGNRSGIGIGTFKYGGFVVDGGRGDETTIPPIISQQDFPEAWRVLLVLDHEVKGINGLPEIEAFNQLPPMSASTSEFICRLMMTQLLPALCEENCLIFGNALAEIQTIIGDYFAPAQGGRFSSHLVEEILIPLTKQGATAIGQSSWGPTGFALFSNETQAFKVLKLLRGQWKEGNRLEFKICTGRNIGVHVLNKKTISERKFKIN